ncbi:integrase core domain-containing protein [Streptomyces sp. NPDC008137]|uniref:integrase core domain-containing protein n=1 Tax=Streptomyces sp. NPDC008137 TaxID=3364813 RepID=UPI0036E4E53B
MNAVSEAFNSVLKVEYAHRHAFATRAEDRIRIATWITDFYNARRLHSVCGFKSPIDYEHDYQDWHSRTQSADGICAPVPNSEATALGHPSVHSLPWADQWPVIRLSVLSGFRLARAGNRLGTLETR